MCQDLKCLCWKHGNKKIPYTPMATFTFSNPCSRSLIPHVPTQQTPILPPPCFHSRAPTSLVAFLIELPIIPCGQPQLRKIPRKIGICWGADFQQPPPPSFNATLPCFDDVVTRLMELQNWCDFPHQAQWTTPSQEQNKATHKGSYLSYIVAFF